MKEVLEEHAKHPEKREGQSVLAEEMMLSTRSADDLQKVKRCAVILYGDIDVLTEEMIRDVMDELPLEKLEANAMKGKMITDYLVALKMAESKSRRTDDEE